VNLPVDSQKERHLILVDLHCVQARYLAPSSCRVVAILQILRSKNECRQEHAATTLKGAHRVGLVWLFHGEVMLGYMWLDKDQIVQRHLQCGVTGS